jgi:GH43 family beta-xylosidase
MRRYPYIPLLAVFLLPALRVDAGAPPRSSTYRNPRVRSVADPFVLKHRGEYYLYRTSIAGALDVMTSRDLVHWRPGPAVWRPETPQAPNAHRIWAPEVRYENGNFLLYFSASDATGAPRLWLAVARSPLGPFKLYPGGPLTDPWRIDVHMFRDDDGQRYLYSCHRQWLPLEQGSTRVEGCRIASPWERPGESWQIMVNPEVPWEGVWVEAPTVLKDRSGYYLLYSAPDAESPNYQIGYATARQPLGPWTKRGVLVPTVPGVPGPGHQDVVLAPDNLTPYLLYHRKRLSERGWDRDLMLDRLALGGGRLQTRAPTMSPQALPPAPAFADHFDSGDSLRSWSVAGGSWLVDSKNQELAQRHAEASGRAGLKITEIASGVIEVNARRLEGNGGFGLELSIGSQRLPLTLLPEGRRVFQFGEGQKALPEEFDPRAHHQIRVTRRGGDVEVRLDGLPVGQTAFAIGRAKLELVTQRSAAAFSGIALTPYTEPRPLGPPEPQRPVWHRVGDRIEQRYLGLQRQVHPLTTRLPERGTLSVHLQGWALGTSRGVRKYGVQLEAPNSSGRFEAYIDPSNQVLATHGSVNEKELPWQNSDLPLGFDYTKPHVLTVIRRGSQWRVTVDGGSAQTRSADLKGVLRLSLVCEDARVVFRGIRVIPLRGVPK